MNKNVRKTNVEKIWSNETKLTFWSTSKTTSVLENQHLTSLSAHTVARHSGGSVMLLGYILHQGQGN